MNNAYISDSGIIVSDDTYHSLTDSLDYLGSGVSRKVFALDEFSVLKIATSYNYSGRDCNLAEVSAWLQVVGTELEQHFARVLAHSESGEWLVMERAEFTLREDYDTFDRWSSSAGRMLSRIGVDDLHSGNVAQFPDGSVKVIDYGFNNLTADAEEVAGRWIPSEEEECECEDCLYIRHRAESCDNTTGHNHAQCFNCGANACDTREHVIARNSRCCEAVSGCNGNLAGFFSDLLMCEDHMPIIGQRPIDHVISHACLWTRHGRPAALNLQSWLEAGSQRPVIHELPINAT